MEARLGVHLQVVSVMQPTRHRHVLWNRPRLAVFRRGNGLRSANLYTGCPLAHCRRTLALGSSSSTWYLSRSGALQRMISILLAPTFHYPAADENPAAPTGVAPR